MLLLGKLINTLNKLNRTVTIRDHADTNYENRQPMFSVKASLLLSFLLLLSAVPFAWRFWVLPTASKPGYVRFHASQMLPKRQSRASTGTPQTSAVTPRVLGKRQDRSPRKHAAEYRIRHSSTVMPGSHRIRHPSKRIRRLSSSSDRSISIRFSGVCDCWNLVGLLMDPSRCQIFDNHGA